MSIKTILVGLPFVVACTQTQDGSINDYLNTLGHLPSDPTAKVTSEPSAPVTMDHRTCTTRSVEETRQYENIAALSANSNTLWPGAVVRGDAVYSGLFTPITLPRAPMTFSISLAHLAGAHSVTLQQPTLSSAREAIAQLLNQQVTGGTPANIAIEIEKLDSEKQLAMALGAGTTWAGLVAVNAGFDWSRTEQKSRYLVKFTQAYYTLDVDPFTDASAAFDPSVTQADVEAVASEGNPPVYVSSITYGRMVVFTFESDRTATELGAALEATYRGPGATSGQLSVDTMNVLAQTKMTAYILGGSGAEAAKAIDGVDGLFSYIRTGGDYSPQSPGAPIAYKLSHLADNVLARLSWTDDYEIQECKSLPGTVRVTMQSMTLDSAAGEPDGSIEAYGVVTVSSTASTTGATLWDRSASTPLTLRPNEPNATASTADVAAGDSSGSFIDVCAAIYDDDYLDADDFLGSTCYRISLDTGWQREFDIVLTGTDKRLVLHFKTEPR